MTYFRRFFISGIRIHIPLADPHYGRLLLFPWISLTVRGGSLAWFPLLLSVDAKLRSVLADFSPITETQWSGTLGDIPAIIWAYRPDWRFFGTVQYILCMSPVSLYIYTVQYVSVVNHLPNSHIDPTILFTSIYLYRYEIWKTLESVLGPAKHKTANEKWQHLPLRGYIQYIVQYLLFDHKYTH